MIEPLAGMEPSMTRRIGVTLLIAGTTLLVAGSLERALNVPPRASVLLALFVGVGAAYTWSASAQYAESFVAISTAFALLLPVAICLHIFSELLVVQ